jgi:hypothetical protein
MDASARSSLVYGLVAATWVAALAAAGHALHLQTMAEAPPDRPAADAPVSVVKAPPGALPERRCATCAMGAARGWV